MPKRYRQQFLVKDAWTERHRKSAIPFMQRLLNDEDKQKKDILKQVDNFPKFKEKTEILTNFSTGELCQFC